MGYGRQAETIQGCRQYPEAETAFTKAIQCDPNLSLLYGYYAAHLKAQGLDDDVEKISAKAKELAKENLVELGTTELMTKQSLLLRLSLSSSYLINPLGSPRISHAHKLISAIMSQILNKFSFGAPRVNSQIFLTAILLWLVVLGCTLSSIFAQPFNKRQRIFWIFIVVALPLVGVLAYIPFSFRREDMPHIFLPKSKKSGRRNVKSPILSK